MVRVVRMIRMGVHMLQQVRMGVHMLQQVHMGVHMLRFKIQNLKFKIQIQIQNYNIIFPNRSRKSWKFPGNDFLPKRILFGFFTDISDF